MAWINASPRGAVNAHESLRKILAYPHALIIESACADIPASGAMIGDDGLITDISAQELIGQSVGYLLAAATDQGPIASKLSEQQASVPAVGGSPD